MVKTKLNELEIREKVSKFKEILSEGDLIWKELKDNDVSIKIDTSQKSFFITDLTWKIDLK